MLRLALRTLRTRRGGAIGSFIALLLGAAVLTACGTLLESGLRNSTPPERYAAADIVVAGRQHIGTTDRSGQKTPLVQQALTERVPVPTDVVARVGRIPGAKAVIADVSVPVSVSSVSGVSVPGRLGTSTAGHGWSTLQLGTLHLLSGTAPRSMREVVLDSDLARRARVRPGSAVQLMHDGLPKRFRVAGIVGLEDAKPPRHSAVYFSDAYLRQLAPRKAPDAVGVIAAPGVSTDKLKHRIVDALVNDNLSVHTGAKRSTAEFLDIANEPFSLLTLSAGIGSNVLLIAVFIVASTMALSIQHRRREIALLRAVGATPRQIRSMVRGEGMVLSVVGGVLGWPVGIWLVRWMSGRLAHYGLVPADFRPYVSPLPALGAVITVLATSVMAAHIAARRANRIRPTEALGDSSKEKTELGRGRKITGVILLISSIGLFVGGLTQGGDFTTQVSLANSLVLMVAITAGVLGPALSRAAILVLTPVLRRSKVTGYLAAANSRTNLLRMAGGVTPLVLAVSFAATVVFAQTTGLHVSSDQLSKGMLAQHVLAAPEGIPSSVVQRVRTLHGVDAATGVVRTKVVAVQQGSDGVPVTLSAQGLDSSSLHQTVDLQIGQGDWRGLSPGTVAMSRTASSWLDVGLGDKLPVYLGDGTRVEPRVVAIYERGLAFADLTFESSLLRQHTTTGLDQSVLVKTAGSTVGDELRKVAQEYPGITVVDQLDPDEQTEELKASAWVSYLLVGMLIVYTAITVINSQVMNTAARRREFALLRLSGASKRHIMRMMRWETASVIIAGVVMGTAASALPLVLVALALSGTPWPSVPILWYLGIVGSLSALAAIGALGTSRLVLRVRPVEAIGTKE